MSTIWSQENYLQQFDERKEETELQGLSLDLLKKKYKVNCFSKTRI